MVFNADRSGDAAIVHDDATDPHGRDVRRAEATTADLPIANEAAKPCSSSHGIAFPRLSLVSIATRDPCADSP